MSDRNAAISYRFCELVGPHTSASDNTVYYTVICQPFDQSDKCLMIHLLFTYAMRLLNHRVELWSETYLSIKKKGHLPCSQLLDSQTWQYAEDAITWFNQATGSNIVIEPKLIYDANDSVTESHQHSSEPSQTSSKPM